MMKYLEKAFPISLFLITMLVTSNSIAVDIIGNCKKVGKPFPRCKNPGTVCTVESGKQGRCTTHVAGCWCKLDKVCSKSDSDTCTDPGLVELSSFTAIPSSKGISLNWTTKTELDSQGFKIWRAIPKLGSYCGCSGNIGDYTQIQVLDEEGKPVLIPAKGTETSGYDYSYLDEGAKPGIAYCYALEDVDSKGESKFYFEYVAFTQDNLEETQDNLELTK